MIKRFLTVVLITVSIKSIGQRNSSSPYSFFGIGVEVSRTTVEQASMGGIGVGLKDYNHLNFINPASNADIRFATYALGGELSLLNVSNEITSESNNTTSLRYVALGLPLGNKAGFSIGLQPTSSVGYALITESKDADGNNIEASRFTGNGGTTRLFGGFGINVFKELALGIEVGFLFGNIENNIINQRADVSLASKHEEDTRVRGRQFKAGGQYKKKIKKNLDLNIGMTLQLENDLTLSGNERLFSLSFTGNGREIPRDILYDRSIERILSTPLKIIIGVGLGEENKWYAGIDYETGEAFDNEGIIPSGSAYKFESSNRISLGGYYIPKRNSISSYWDRITYRTGLRFEKTGLLVDETGGGDNFNSINDFGINVGLGLPMPRQLSNINIAFEYGQKGTTNNNLIKENYFNIKLSLSLNSGGWLKKRQID